MRTPSLRSLGVLGALVAGVAAPSPPPALAQEVTTADLEQAAGDTSSWLMYGRDYHGQRFVELDQITPENVDRLHPAWVFATGGENRGLEATPLVHDGVIYLSADESRVFALDARTGA
ncbi:MAG: PQQ-dependent dehydrogenase, methanol/ethanol family, partial [Acidobacteria bacterium]|nr:PQQ-dependent dehydrogenase, methanol/ethanol family [Acidobacteriota bacterium]